MIYVLIFQEPNKKKNKKKSQLKKERRKEGKKERKRKRATKRVHKIKKSNIYNTTPFFFVFRNLINLGPPPPPPPRYTVPLMRLRVLVHT